MICPHCGKSPGDSMRPGLIIALARVKVGLSQLELLQAATDHASESEDEPLAAALMRRDAQWLSRLETTGTKSPPFGELEALCAVLEIDPAKTAKGERS